MAKLFAVLWLAFCTGIGGWLGFTFGIVCLIIVGGL
jgi:hypothetical protein